MTSYNRWLIKLKKNISNCFFLKLTIYSTVRLSSNFGIVTLSETKIHNISLIYRWLVLLPNATLNTYNMLSVLKMESQNTWVALTHCTTLSKLFISCLLHHRRTLAVLSTNRQLWPRTVQIYHHSRMPWSRKNNDEKGGQGLIQDLKDGSLFQMPPGPRRTAIHVARSGNFNLWRGSSTWCQLADISHLKTT